MPLSNAFSNIQVKTDITSNNPSNPNFQYYFGGYIQGNTCYQLSQANIYLIERGNTKFLDLTQSYKLSNDLIIKNSENDANLLSN